MKTKNYLTTTLFLLFTLSASTQITFQEDLNNTFPGTSDGELQFADIDGDGDLDLFVLGYKESFGLVGDMFLNDGYGIFTEVETSITGRGYAFMAFEDVDNDGDQDLLTAGQGSLGYGTFLYLNDGYGNFQEMSNTAFNDMAFGDVKFADVDGDGDKDAMFAGLINSGAAAVSELYLNDGQGNFTLSPEDDFLPAYQGEIAFGDIDNDDDLDMIITGRDGITFDPSASLYTNDGTGDFTLVANTPFVPVNISSNDFEDIDADGDLDLLITGFASNGIKTELYLNDGSGNYSLSSNNAIVDVIFGDCEFADVDNDGDPDLLIAGRKGAIPDETAKLYLNDGQGNFTEVNNLPFLGATGGGVDLGDVDGDGDLDVMICGLAPDDSNYTKLYFNDLLVVGTEELETALVKVSPNPFADYLEIDLSTVQEAVSIELTNAIGQRFFYSQNITDTVLRIPGTQLASGVYFLKVELKTGEFQSISVLKQ